MTLPAKKWIKEGAKRRDSTAPAKEREHESSAVKSRLSSMQKALGNRAIERIYRTRQKEAERESEAGKKRPSKAPKRKREKPAPSEVGIKLPAPKAAPAEKAEKPKVLALEGRSESMAAAFADAPASQIAATYPSLGKILSKRLEKERAETVKNAPKLTASLTGEGGKAGKKLVKVGTSAKKEPLAGGVEEEREAEERVPEHKNLSAPVDNEKVLNSLAQGASENFIGWFKNNFRSFLNSIKTSDPGLNTKAGLKPKVKLEGNADPARSDRDRDEAQSAVEEERDTEILRFAKHPGQERIRPKTIRREFGAAPPPKKEEPVKSEENGGMRDYLEMQIPKNVREKADELLKPILRKGLEKFKNGVMSSAKRRDADKRAEEEKKRAEAQELNRRAQKDQEEAVAAGRRNVAGEQKRGIEDAAKAAEEFAREAAKEHESTKKSIADTAKKAETDAGKEIEKGEKEAGKLKEEGEREAKRKKRELEAKQRDKSWWERAADAIKSAVKAITEAIDKIFAKIREAVKKVIDKAKKLAIALINKARKFIIKKLEAFRKWAKKMVNRYVKNYFPALAEKINRAIDRFVERAKKVVNRVAEGLVAGIKALAAALSKALDKILSTFQTALKAAVGIVGAALTGDFAEALKIAIEAACSIAGIDSKPIFGFLRRAGALFAKILKSPGKFFKNLAEAVGGGVRNFAKNIKKHLVTGLFAWLTGVLSEAQIELPKRFDLKGIFFLAMQILGLTYANIKARIIKRYPRAQGVIDKLEKGFEIVKELVTKGPVALWKRVASAMRNFKETVISGIRNFVITTLVKEGVLWLLSLLNPVSAIVKVVKLLYDFIMFLVESFDRIKSFVISVYNSLAAIAAGSLGPAKKAVEESLAKILPVAVNLLARLAGLGGIAKTVKKIIAKVSRPVNRVIDRVVEKAVAFAKKLLGRGKRGFKKARKKIKKIFKIERRIGRPISFAAGKERHRLWIAKKRGRAVPMAASRPLPVAARIESWRREAGKLPQQKRKRAEKLIANAEAALKNLYIKAETEEKIEKEATKDRKVTEAEAKRARYAERSTVDAQKRLAEILKELLPLVEGEAEGLQKRFKPEIENMHPAARSIFVRQLRKMEAEKIDSWKTLAETVEKRSKKMKLLSEKPLLRSHDFGRSVQQNEAVEALESVGREKKEGEETTLWQRYESSRTDKRVTKIEFISHRVGGIHARKSKSAGSAYEAVKKYIFDKGHKGRVTGALKDYYRAALESSLSGREHYEYRPEIPQDGMRLENGIFSIKYSYTSPKHEKKSFVVEFDFRKMDTEAETTQKVRGENLTLKEPGSRGRTVSSGMLKDFEGYGGEAATDRESFLELEFLRSFVKKRFEEKGYGKEKLEEAAKTFDKRELLKELNAQERDDFRSEFESFKREMKGYKGDQRFDSAHLVADWFGGSGYKEALNLVVTSAEYNRVVMAGAEKSIEKEIKSNSPSAIFNLTVAATWDQLTDKEIKNAATVPAIYKQIMQIKSRLDLKRDESREVAKKAADELYAILASKQDPRRVLRVKYYAGEIVSPVEKPLTERGIGCDIWMSSFFKFDKREKCLL